MVELSTRELVSHLEAFESSRCGHKKQETGGEGWGPQAVLVLRGSGFRPRCAPAGQRQQPTSPLLQDRAGRQLGKIPEAPRSRSPGPGVSSLPPAAGSSPPVLGSASRSAGQRGSRLAGQEHRQAASTGPAVCKQCRKGALPLPSTGGPAASTLPPSPRAATGTGSGPDEEPPALAVFPAGRDGPGHQERLKPGLSEG